MLSPAAKRHLVHFWLKKVLLVIAILVQFTKQMHRRIKPTRFDEENCKAEADFSGMGA